MMVGKPAPAFTLPAAFAGESAAAPVRTVSLSDFAGRWLLLCWYPRDFSFVCPTELVALSDRISEFTDLDCAVVAISTDSVYAHRAWLSVPRDKNGVADLRFPLLSDAAHATSRAYGLLNETDGTAARASLLLWGKCPYACVAEGFHSYLLCAIVMHEHFHSQEPQCLGSALSCSLWNKISACGLERRCR